MTLRRVMLVAGIIGAPVLATVVVFQLGARACVAAIDGPEGRWVKDAQLADGPRRAPPDHALLLTVDATRFPEAHGEDEHGGLVLVRCEGASTPWTCFVPARAAAWRISTSGPCRDLTVRKTSMGSWVCDPPEAEKLVVRSVVRGAWEVTASLEALLVVPAKDGGPYLGRATVIVSGAAGRLPEATLRLGPGPPSWLTCVTDGDSGKHRCLQFLDDHTGTPGETIRVTAEATVLGVCPTEEPCTRPHDSAALRIDSISAAPL